MIEKRTSPVPNDKLNPKFIREQLEDAKSRVQLLTTQLKCLEDCCHHEYGEPQKRYEIQVKLIPNINRPIHQGIHISYENEKVETKIPTWTRVCHKCGMKQTTTETKQITTDVPAFD